MQRTHSAQCEQCPLVITCFVSRIQVRDKIQGQKQIYHEESERTHAYTVDGPIERCALEVIFV